MSEPTAPPRADHPPLTPHSDAPAAAAAPPGGEPADVVYVTNRFTLADGAAIDTVADLVADGVRSTSSRNPGYLGDLVLRSVDGREVLNLSAWEGGTARLATNHAGNLANPSYTAQMAALAPLATSAQQAYTVTLRHGRIDGTRADAPVTDADVQRWLDVWNTHDIDRIVTLFTDDVVMHQPQNPTPLDKPGMARFFTMLFTAYPDIRFDPDGHVIQGLEVASWERIHGTMTGTFTDPGTGQGVPPTGRSFDIPGAMHLTYVPGVGGAAPLIREVRIYWDRMLLSAQLGLGAPPPAPAATAPAPASASDPKARYQRRLVPEECALLLVDFLTGFDPGLQTIPRERYQRNVDALAQLAATFRARVPVFVLGDEGGFRGDFYAPITRSVPDAPRFARHTPSAMQEPTFRDALAATGRRRIVLGGISLDLCTLHTSLDLLRAGYEVYVLVDCSGTESMLVEHAAMLRLTQAGAVMTNWVSLASEWMGDWNTPEGAEVGRLYQQLSAWGGQ